MALILLLALLQAPDDLAAFLASLEKSKATPVQQLEKIDAWARQDPDEPATYQTAMKSLAELLGPDKENA